MMLLLLRMPLHHLAGWLVLVAVASIPGVALTLALIDLARWAAVIWPCPFCAL